MAGKENTAYSAESLSELKCHDAEILEASATEVRDVFGPNALAAAVRLMNKYADIPMDFPDATLVWTAEQTGTDSIMTLDRRGFSSFRFAKNRRFDLVLDL